MIAKYGENRYVDMDLVSSIDGDYKSEDPSHWATKFVCNGVADVVYGQSGKNLMAAFEWKWRNSIVNLIAGTPGYKKNVNP